MDDKDKVIAYLAQLLCKVICDVPVTSSELQALDNIINDLPSVDAEDFRY